MTEITVIGAGLAGAEAAWQAAQMGIKVTLYEMRPQKMSPAHHTGDFAELVCSNSLRGAALENAVGLLKEEMRRLGSLIIDCADLHQVPAGGALAVDREGFSACVTRRLESHPNLTVHRAEVTAIPETGIVVVASGPLTSGNLAADIARITGGDNLYFHDAVAPIISGPTIDQSIVFRASRWGRGDDYLNCPMNEEEYNLFYNALLEAEIHAPKSFEKEIYFEGCMPVEAMAVRGRQTLSFGPMKPIGLVDPRTGRRPYAVVQLRQDNAAATLFNMVGFQTHLKWQDQQRVFRLIPGLAEAEFVRYGVMHRNTFINSPRLLLPTMQLKERPTLFFAGQMTGVEGYVESAADGIVAGINAARLAREDSPVVFPPETAIGSLCRYITQADARQFQPMNITYGLLPPLENRVRDKKEKNQLIAARALAKLASFMEEVGIHGSAS